MTGNDIRETGGTVNPVAVRFSFSKTVRLAVVKRLFRKLFGKKGR